MDLSCYIDDVYDQAVKGHDGENIPVTEEKNVLMPLTQEEIDRAFFNFDQHPQFIGKFEGAGQEYSLNNNVIRTWRFKDENGLDWLIPQWHTMDEPQGSFEGFSKETPGQFNYFIHYLGKKDAAGGKGKHSLRIFRKK